MAGTHCRTCGTSRSSANERKEVSTAQLASQPSWYYSDVLEIFLRTKWHYKMTIFYCALSHHLSLSSCWAALLSFHCAGWLLYCLSLRHPLVLSLRRPSLPSHHIAVVYCCRRPRTPSNAPAAIEHHYHHQHHWTLLYHSPPQQLPSIIATLKHQWPPLSIGPSNTNAHCCHPPPLVSIAIFASSSHSHRSPSPPPSNAVIAIECPLYRHHWTSSSSSTTTTTTGVVYRFTIVAWQKKRQ
jgi:hypothetical protein